MFALFRNRFGIPGIISVVALVFAMLGGAYAASNSGGDATASAKKGKKGKKGKRGPRGPKGAKGDPGPAGPAGPTGPAGPKGDKGDPGANGTNGTNGTNGQSVTLTDLPPGECENFEGGVELSVGGSSEEVCNGLEGPPGQKGDKGDPWTPESELPQGATLTGTFALDWPIDAAEIFRKAPISFPVKLGAELADDKVHAVATNGDEVTFVSGAPVIEEDPVNCLGSVEDPTALDGHLCVYVGAYAAPGFFNVPLIEKPVDTFAFGTQVGAITSGAMLVFSANGTNPGYATGSWAVTAPPAP